MKGCSSFNLTVDIPIPLRECLVGDENVYTFKNACKKYELEKLGGGKTYLIYKKSGLEEEYFFLSVRKLNFNFFRIGSFIDFSIEC